MDGYRSLEALPDVLNRISENPHDLSLHAEHIRLAQASGMDDQVAAARQMLTTFWPAEGGEEVWLPMIEARIKQGVDTLEDILQVLDLFQTAEEGYLSITLLQKHIEFIIGRHAYFNSLEPRPESLGEIFLPEWTSAMVESVVQKGAGHLTKGHLLWNAYFEWEMEQLEDIQLQGEARTNLIQKIEDMLLDRLKQPHSTHEETFQQYSTFTTNYKPPDIYENLMVAASKKKASAVKVYEKREQNEQYLAQSNYSPEAYNYYLTYERRARKIDLSVISMLYERAISDTARRRFEGEENAEAALKVFWAGYCDILRTYEEGPDRQREVLQRATRSVPGSGLIWARYIRFLEATESDANTLLQVVSEIYDQALSFGLIQKDIEEIVPFTLARASLVKRAIMALEDAEGAVEILVKVLEEGITMVRSVSRQGDPRFRLEKFLADLYVSLAGSPDLAATVWQTTAKYYKTSYMAWTQYIDSLVRQEKYDEARTVFKEILNKNLDWPEALFDAWVTFEHLHGTLDELYECLDKIDKAQAQVNSRRAKEAEKAAYHAAQASSQAGAASSLITEAVQNAPKLNEVQGISASSMDVDEPASEATRKRKPEESGLHHEGNKKSKIDDPSPTLKRDRENSTLFVAGLPTNVTEGDLIALFKDCGAIREVKITNIANSCVATVEFVDRESIPAGLTKDKKRINGQEIAVHLAWKSTLYVTNFLEKADDEYIRRLFGQFGVIFDVRWPSKKFKATRRFCYVQFTSPDAAQAALSLHGKELESGLSLQVLISDPGRKRERTDASANDKEVYVAGLSKFATRDDLEKLFKTYGVVKDVRLLKNDNGLCKGVAFVEFEDEPSAQRALQANNHDLKNRRIAVTLSDSRVRARHTDDQTASGLGRRSDLRSRSIRIKGLPPGTQEGLLQQILEKFVTVKRLEVFEEAKEATAELESAAGVGKLLLLQEPVQFNGASLQISEEVDEHASKRASASQPKAGVSMFIPRNAASRPRAGLGSLKKPTRPSVATSDKVQQTTLSPQTSVKSQDDFRKLLG